MLLELPGLTVTDIKHSGDDTCYTVESDFAPSTCPKCSSLFAEFYNHGPRKQFFHDSPVRGQRLCLKIERRRFKCRSCGGTFEEPMDHMHPDHLMTLRLRELIIEECYRNKFTEVARYTGVTEGNVRKVFRSYVDELTTLYKFRTPEVLGIDEVNITQMRCVLTNLEERSIIDMLPERSREVLTGYLLRMDRKKVRLVCTDMYRAYRRAVATAFPSAELAVDRFHVQRLANNIMNDVRAKEVKKLPKSVRKGLRNARYAFLSRNFNLSEAQQDILLEWCTVIPILKDVYFWKERFLDIWENETKAGAQAEYAKWAAGVEASGAKIHYQPILTDFDEWYDPIFAW